MRTTIELPEELLRRAKATAAMRGMKLKDLVTQILDYGLKNQTFERDPGTTKRRELPVMIPATGRRIPNLTNAQLPRSRTECEHRLHDTLKVLSPLDSAPVLHHSSWPATGAALPSY